MTLSPETLHPFSVSIHQSLRLLHWKLELRTSQRLLRYCLCGHLLMRDILSPLTSCCSSHKNLTREQCVLWCLTWIPSPSSQVPIDGLANSQLWHSVTDPGCLAGWKTSRFKQQGGLSNICLIPGKKSLVKEKYLLTNVCIWLKIREHILNLWIW